MCRQYGYTVVFDGIGDPPEDQKHLGHCSQMAVFTLSASTSAVPPDISEISSGAQPYKLVRCMQSLVVL